MSGYFEIIVITSCSWVNLIGWLGHMLYFDQPFAKCKQMRSETPYFTSIVIVYLTTPHDG